MHRILVVDDEASSRSIVAAWLRSPEREVEEAADGEEALERIALARPDLVITDVVMPRMNGWTLVRKLRAMPETAPIPVLFVSSLEDRDDRIHGLSLGDDYVTKPVDLEELELRVNVALKRAGAKDTAGGGIHGSLRDMTIASVLAALSMERSTGLLTLSGVGVTANLVLREGDVLRARFDDPPRHGVAVLVSLLRWTDGTFDFDSRAVGGEDELGMTTAALLLEAAQRLDEEG